MSQRIYTGIRWPNGVTYVLVQAGNVLRELRPTRGHLHHLPARFDWATVNPASANLSHSLLRNACGTFLADAYYEAVCELWVRWFGADCWVVTREDVCEVVAQMCWSQEPARYERRPHRRPVCMGRWCLNG